MNIADLIAVNVHKNQLNAIREILLNEIEQKHNKLKDEIINALDEFGVNSYFFETAVKAYVSLKTTKHTVEYDDILLKKDVNELLREIFDSYSDREKIEEVKTKIENQLKNLITTQINITNNHNVDPNKNFDTSGFYVDLTKGSLNPKSF